MPSHPINYGARRPPPHSRPNPSNGEGRNTTMILASSMSGHKHLHESYHWDSDKEVATIIDPLEITMPQGNVAIVSTSLLLTTSWYGLVSTRKDLWKTPWSFLASKTRISAYVFHISIYGYLVFLFWIWSSFPSD